MLPVLEINYPDWISSVSTLLTFFVAIFALFSWKQQKRFEIKIEIFALSRGAVDLVRYLRNPVSIDGEIDKDLLEKWNGNINPISRQAMVFQSRLKFHEDRYKEILFLRERIWANFGDDHIYYKFYDFVIRTIIDLNHAHWSNVELSDRENFPEAEWAEQRKKDRAIIVGRQNDEINIRLDSLFEQLSKKR